MTKSADLEQQYRRLLAWYPGEFRRESGLEILGVLMDSAADGQDRVGLAEAADLIRGGLWMRLRPGPARPPRTVLAAIRLMCLGAAANLAGLITYVATAGSVRSAVARGAAAQAHALLIHLTAVELGAPVAVVLWLWLAWANGQGRYWARGMSAVSLLVVTMSLVFLLGAGAAVYAPAELIATATVWLIGLAAVVLVLVSQSSPHYRQEAARQ